MITTIEKLLEERGLTFADVAQRSGITEQRVEAIACGRWLPGSKQRQSLARVFDVAVEDIVWGHSMSPRNVRYHRFGLKKDFS